MFIENYNDFDIHEHIVHQAFVNDFWLNDYL